MTKHLLNKMFCSFLQCFCELMQPLVYSFIYLYYLSNIIPIYLYLDIYLTKCFNIFSMFLRFIQVLVYSSIYLYFLSSSSIIPIYLYLNIYLTKCFTIFSMFLRPYATFSLSSYQSSYLPNHLYIYICVQFTYLNLSIYLNQCWVAGTLFHQLSAPY